MALFSPLEYTRTVFAVINTKGFDIQYSEVRHPGWPWNKDDRFYEGVSFNMPVVQ